MGKGPGSFNDIGKKAKDLLFKDYFYDQKLSFSSTTSSGLKFNTTSVRKGEDVSSEAKTELKFGQVETEFKIDTKNKIHAKLEFEDAAPGLKLVVSGVLPDAKSTRLGVQYKQAHVHATAAAGLVAQPHVESTVAVGSKGFVVGAELGYDTATSSTSKYNFGVSYSEDDYTAALLLTDKADTLKASFYQKLKGSPSAVAVELAHKFSKKDITFTAGGSYTIDDLTESKVRVNNRGIVAGLLEHEFRPKSKITLSAEVDSKALEKSSKLGVVLTLKA